MLNSNILARRNSTGFLVCQDLFFYLSDTLFYSVCINFKDNKKGQGKSRGFEMNSGRSQFLSPSCLTGIYKKKQLEPYMCVYYKQNKTKQKKREKSPRKGMIIFLFMMMSPSFLKVIKVSN